MSKLPDANPTLTAFLVRQQRQMVRVANTSAFARSGTSVSAEGVVTVDGELDVAGALVVGGSETVNGPLAVHGTAAFDGATTIGGTLGVTGPTTLGAPTTVSGSLGVSGPMTVSGTLSLPAGIIDNAALASPVSGAIGHDDNGATVFAVSTTRTAQATYTFTVPAGFTQALIFAEGQASAVNTTGVVATLYVGAAVNGVEPPGWAAAQDVAPAGYGGATRAVVKLLTGLTGGGTFTVSTRLYASTAWAGHAANSCNIDATVVFLR